MNSTRRHLLWLLPAAAAVASFPAQSQATRISLEQLQAMFEGMRAKTKWNVDGPLLWGYFFFDPSETKLQAAAKDLQATGYRVVDVGRVEGKALYRLHVERVEAHTPMSLHLRNSELYAFAQQHALASYDGMDVGPVP